MRKFAVMLALVCAGGLVLAQKDKDKAKETPKPAKMTLVKIDVKAMTLTLKGEKGKEEEYKATKDTKFIGPQGRARKIDDDALKAGVMLGIVADGKTLKEVHLPRRDSVKMTLVKIDVKAMTLTLQGDKGSKPEEYKATKDTEFIGPQGGKRTIDDDVLKAGVMLGIVADGKTLKEVHLPRRDSAKDKKDKDKKEEKKDKDKKSIFDKDK